MQNIAALNCRKSYWHSDDTWIFLLFKSKQDTENAPKVVHLSRRKVKHKSQLHGHNQRRPKDMPGARSKHCTCHENTAWPTIKKWQFHCAQHEKYSNGWKLRSESIENAAILPDVFKMQHQDLSDKSANRFRLIRAWSVHESGGHSATPPVCGGLYRISL